MPLEGLVYFEQHFLLSNRLFKFLIRIRPDQSSNEQLVLLCAVLVFALPIILYQFYQLYTLNANMQSIIKVLMLMLPALYFLYCYYVVFVYLTEMKSLFNHVKLDYKLLKDENELKIIEKYTKESKRYTSLLVVFANVYFMSIIFPSIFNVFMHIFGTLDDTHLTLPCSINGVLYAGFLYYSLLIYQIIVIIILMTIIVAFVALYWVSIQHACGQFSVMIFKIHQPFESDQIHIKKAWLRRTLQEESNWIVDIIKCYTRITEYVNIINNISRWTYLIAIFMSMLLVLFNFLYLFELPLVLENISETINCCIYIVGSLSIIYITFYVGQLLINHSNDTFEELCYIPYYTLSIKTQKILIFVLRRNIKPVELSIGGVFVASHVVFAALMQKAFSFATVYYSVTKI